MTVNHANKAVEQALEPRTYKEAMLRSDWSSWKSAMDAEVSSLRKNQTWRLKRRSNIGGKVLHGKWVFRIKRNPDGSINKYKARWVVKGFEQEQGSDYNDTFAAVVKPMSYKVLFALAAAFDWEIEQMDVVTAFLYGTVTEDVYVEQPHGFNDGDDDNICHLNKALYGLKQSPRIWYNTLTSHLKELGFKALSADLSVFIRNTTIIAIYVDDLLIVGPGKDDIDHTNRLLVSAST